jgi:uncharacterized Fe-S cluster-containing protein
MVMHLMQNFGVLIVLRVYCTQVDNGRCQEITAASLKTSFEIDNSCVLSDSNRSTCTRRSRRRRRDDGSTEDGDESPATTTDEEGAGEEG